MFEAAERAYADAGVDPRRDIQSFVCCTEDFWEGNSIADEYMPDQLGAVHRPLCTVSGDGLLGVAQGWMQIATGLADVVAVEAHSKLSEVRTHDAIVRFALDPIWTRAVDVPPVFLAGLEMRRYLHERRNHREACAAVVAKNRGNARQNPLAAYGAHVNPEAVLASPIVADPLKEGEISRPTDGAVVCVLASERLARRAARAVFVDGIGWSTAHAPVEDRDFAEASYAAQAARRAYRMADVRRPVREFDLVEIDDTYAYKELQHLEALGLCTPGRAATLTQRGVTSRDGDLPVNVSGGTLGVGHTVEATGLQRLQAAVLQLRGRAGALQLSDVRRALVQSWRGLPTATGAVAVLGTE
jgi:acetyl-CoA C-acetyltransferase